MRFQKIDTDKSNLPSTEKELLDFALKCGMIDLDDVQNQMTKKHKEKLLKQHSFEIWKGSDNRWKTYIPNNTKKSGRKLIVKTHYEDLENFLVSFYEDQSEAKQIEKISLKELYPQWIEYKRLHTTAETYITRIHSDWKTYYQNTEIINIPIKKLTKLELDIWAHKLIKDYSMTKNQYYNVTVIMRQALLYAVDLEIIESSPFSSVKIDGKRLFRRVKKSLMKHKYFLKRKKKRFIKWHWKIFIIV